MDIQREEPWWKWPAIFCGASFVLGIGVGFLMFGERGVVSQETMRMHADNKFASIQIGANYAIDEVESVFKEIQDTAASLSLEPNGRFEMRGFGSDEVKVRSGLWKLKEGGYVLQFDGSNVIKELKEMGNGEHCDFSWRDQGVVVCYVHP